MKNNRLLDIEKKLTGVGASRSALTQWLMLDKDRDSKGRHLRKHARQDRLGVTERPVPYPSGARLSFMRTIWSEPEARPQSGARGFPCELGRNGTKIKVL
jgi:hypothetical protein